MPKPIEEDLSTLSSAEHGLAYLTPNDWALIVDKASRVRFDKGQSIIQMGKRPKGVYLLLKGTARVEIPSQNTFRAVGPGEICGEMSFLEDAITPLFNSCLSFSRTSARASTARWRLTCPVV